MAVTFRCPCQAVLTVADNQAGAQAVCPKCGQRLAVPAPARVAPAPPPELIMTSLPTPPPSASRPLELLLAAAIACHVVGGALILIPAVVVYQAWRGANAVSNTTPYIVAIVAGVVLLATGGTLNQIRRGRRP